MRNQKSNAKRDAMSATPRNTFSSNGPKLWEAREVTRKADADTYHRDHHVICRKTGYATKQEAKAGKYASPAPEGTLHIYTCPNCPNYHLTASPR